MPSIPLREQILTELFNIISAEPTIKVVYRQFKLLDTIPNTLFPCVMIEEDLPEISLLRKTGGFSDVRFQVSLVLAVQDHAQVATALTYLDTAVKRVIALNPTLNGTCMQITIEPESKRMGTEFAPYGLSIRPVTIIYEGAAANGY